jgi:hypothetical protein
MRKLLISSMLKKAYNDTSNIIKDMENIISQKKIQYGDKDSDFPRPYISLLQSQLKEMGFVHPYTPGVFDEFTEEAIADIEGEAGLPITGTLNYYVMKYMMKKLSVNNSSTRRERLKNKNSEKIELDENLSNIKTLSNKVDLNNLTNETKEYLKILNHIAKEDGEIITITSAARDPRDQARIMLNNFKSNDKYEGGGRKYIINLYGKKAAPIADIYAENKTDSEKIEEAANIINIIGLSPHLDGKSLDIDVDDNKSIILNILKKTQEYATVNILDEDSHIHLTIKSLNPGGTFKVFHNR